MIEEPFVVKEGSGTPSPGGLPPPARKRPER